MDKIRELALKYSLFIIENNSQSQGALFYEKLTGSFGHLNGTSFFPGKNLGALGDTRVVTTNNDVLANKIQVLRNYGSNKKYFNETIGYNLRLDELQIAFLPVKLELLSKWTAQRQEMAFNELLKDIPELIPPKTAVNATHSYHLFVVQSGKEYFLADANHSKH